MKKSLAVLAFAAMVGVAGTATAATTISFVPGASSPGNGQTVVYNFDDAVPASLVTGPLVQIKSPPADVNGAPPANSMPAGTNYLSVLGGGLATILFTGPVSGFSFDWGSIDSYNVLTILPFGGGDSIIVPGTTFTNTPANGDQVAQGTNGLFSVVGTAGTQYIGFDLATSTNSFEIDNVAVPGAVPEPATWAMMMLGMGAVGFALRRKARLSEVAFEARIKAITYGAAA